MGEKVAAIIMAMLGVIGAYNILSSSNTQGIIGESAKGGVGLIKALEGKA